MKKLIYIFTAILAFLVGVLGFYISFYLTPVEIKEIKNVVPLHEVEKNFQRYISHKFLLQEDLIVIKNDDGSFYYSVQGSREKCVYFLDCNGNDYLECRLSAPLHFAGIVENNEVEMIKEIAKRNRQIWEDDSRRGREIYGAKVEIEGYVRMLDWSNNYFSLQVTNIKQISPIRSITETDNIRTSTLKITSKEKRIAN